MMQSCRSRRQRLTRFFGKLAPDVPVDPPRGRGAAKPWHETGHPAALHGPESP